MGLSSKKTKSKTTPVYSKELSGAQQVSQNTYNQGADAANDIAGQFGDLVPSLLNKYQEGNPATNAATQYSADVSSGKYLDGNPFLEDMISQTRGNVTDSVNAAIGIRGQTGGSGQSNILAKQLAEMETRLRYGDYNAERGRMQNAAALAPSLAAADAVSIAPALAAAESAVSLPWVGANNLARNTGGLLGQYTNTTQKQSGGLLGQLLGAGLAAYGGGFGG